MVTHLNGRALGFVTVASGTEVVTLHIWGIPPRHVPGALARMATHRRALRGPAFFRLLGTGRGFGVASADPTHWSLVAAWPELALAQAFDEGQVARSWSRIARERLVVTLRPVASRGSWGGARPFEPVRPPTSTDGPVAALTRARIRPSRIREFWRSVPPVEHDLGEQPGLRLALGIGEAPVGFQGTFSVWDSPGAMRDFAYSRRAHADVIERRARRGWYAEELFARFEVLDLSGTYQGREP